jgi:hypothetical protein
MTSEVQLTSLAQVETAFENRGEWRAFVALPWTSCDINLVPPTGIEGRLLSRMAAGVLNIPLRSCPQSCPRYGPDVREQGFADLCFSLAQPALSRHRRAPEY